MLKTAVIVGPTAVGKSELGMIWAQASGGEIISGDSVQVYKGFTIGSAKPSLSEQAVVPHHLIDILEPDQPFSAAQFQVLAREAINTIRSRQHQPIVVGGTGLYIRALFDPFAFPRGSTAADKEKWVALAREKGSPYLHALLYERDPETAAKLHVNDNARIVRALEVYDLTGKPLSQQRDYDENNYLPLKDVLFVGLRSERSILYRRIEERCETMIRQGLLEEVESLLNHGYSYTLKPMKSIGYRHAVDYLRGTTTKQEMLRLFKRDTRHFAKRQLTWFKRDPRIIWYDADLLSKSQILITLLNACKIKNSPVK